MYIFSTELQSIDKFQPTNNQVSLDMKMIISTAINPIVVRMCEDIGEIDFLATVVFMMGEYRDERTRQG